MDFTASKRAKGKGSGCTSKESSKNSLCTALPGISSLQAWGHKEHHAFYGPKLHPTPFCLFS
jgi:hypothetical protein